MCGIAGGVHTAGAEPLSESVLRQMTGVLSHRGPDDEGFYFDEHGGAALGHRRLSIIDLAGGHQPLSNEDGTVWTVLNGEIYNYRELQNRLQASGHKLKTDTDTEVIVHLYEEYGAGLVQHLRGMFSIAVWDTRKKRLLLLRDRLGQKPLVYRATSTHLYFASELKALLQVPGAPRTLNPRAVDAYLTYQYVPHPECILQEYRKLPPGHQAVWEDGRLTVEPYWQPPCEAGTAPAWLAGSGEWSADQWKSKLRETLTESVRLRMRSDVPLGAFLSGGVDSTIISGLMQEQSERPVLTFSIGFPVKSFDERVFARQAAEHLGTEHHELVVEPQALEVLPRLIWQYDEPFADSSAIPTMALSELTRGHVTVALSGDGGDELFAGYDRYQAVQLAAQFDRLPGFARRMLAARLWQKIPASVNQRSILRRGKRFLAALGEEPQRRYLNWVSTFGRQTRYGLYTAGFLESLAGADSADFLLEAYRGCPSRDLVTRTTVADMLTYLPCDILTKVDLASMTFGLECRSPFLDHHVAELAVAMPLEQKLKGRKGKRILLETFGDLLPESIQQRPKMGFGVPLGDWFRGELRPMLEETLLSSRALQRGLFNPAAVRQLIDEHQQQRWDHSYRLWALICLELWQQMFLDPATPPAAPPVPSGGL